LPQAVGYAPLWLLVFCFRYFFNFCFLIKALFRLASRNQLINIFFLCGDNLLNPISNISLDEIRKLMFREKDCIINWFLKLIFFILFYYLKQLKIHEK
jgi:hypothetical protein